MLERHFRQRIHWAIINEFLKDPHWFSNATDEEKQRMWNASSSIIAAIKEQHGFAFDGTDMKVAYHPARYIPEEHVVTFDEIEYPHLAYQEVAFDRFGNRGPGPTKFIPELEAWLNESAPGWSVQWDRGDIGEGYFIANLHFPTKAAVGAFIERWGKPVE